LIVKFKKVHEGAKIPTRGTKGAACYDAYLPQDYLSLPVGETRVIGLGFQVELPNGFEMQVRPRSGLALKGITVANSPGCVDADYRGEVGVILTNNSGKDFALSKGDRVCQLKLSVCFIMDFQEVEDVAETERGAGGFGSTGLNG